MAAGRPQSRGMGPMAMGPPGTGMPGGGGLDGARLGTQMGARMGTANRAPTGSQRMATGLRTRQGTAAAQGPGVGALTEVQISDRPMTMQGLSGMKTGSIGPKRQIYDKTYYLVELKRRCQELVNEIASMSKELNDSQTDNATYASLEKRYNSLVKTVRDLEGDLADNNLATDKQRAGTAPEEVHYMYMMMKAQNEQQRNEVDQIFLEKRSHEEEIGQMEAAIQSITRAAEERLNELHPDQRRDYRERMEEGNRLNAELAESREELDMVTGRLHTMECALNSDPLRARHQHLSTVRRELEDNLLVCRREVEQGSMSVPEQREILLARVKSDNGEIVAVEKANSNMKFENERLKSQIHEVQVDAEEKTREGSEQQKYEILFTKDQEMSAFIDGFDDSKAEEEKKLKDKQESIQRILENISKSLDLPKEVDPESHLKDMEGELAFKSKQLQNSEMTHNRLSGELAKRESELEKIESLDVKITQERTQVEDKMKQYEKELVDKYEDIDGLKAQGADQLQRLQGLQQSLQERSASMRQQVNFLKLRFEVKGQQLQDDEVARNLEAQEQKIKQFGQTLNTLSSFISQKFSESDVSKEVAFCLETASELNKMLL